MVDGIDLDTAPYNEGEGWKPLGDRTNPRDSWFMGGFDGNGYTIRGLYINQPGSNYMGLFGFVYEAEIKNLRLEDVNISGFEYSAGLAGYFGVGTISNCYVSGSVKGDSYSGGLVGYADQSQITGSHSRNINVSGRSYTGGLIGYAFAKSLIEKSSSFGEIIGTQSSTGGLIGQLQYESSISESYSLGIVTGFRLVGGLVGYHNQNSIIENSYSKSQIRVLEGGEIIGGFIGQVASSELNYNYSVIDIVINTDTVLVGGFTGYFQSGEVQSSFWNTDFSGQIGNSKTDGLDELSYFEMQMESSFADWDFEDVWIMGANTLPELRNNIQDVGRDTVFVSIETEEISMKGYQLNQNYPNPFNPTTQISYGLTEASEVRLKVFDMLGREVATLVSGQQTAGKHSVQFDASNLASGVYIYRIQATPSGGQAGDFVQTKRMMLIK